MRDGGTTTLIGQPAMGVRASFPVYDVTQFEHTILGSNLGGASPALHVPPLARLAAAGRLDLDTLVTHRFPLEQHQRGRRDARPRRRGGPGGHLTHALTR